MDEERERRVIAAAGEVFRRYGFARATIGDIATAAGMSRPALYLAFPNKEAIFAVVCATMTAQTLGAIRAELADLPTLRARLGYTCERWVVGGYETVAALPDARDLFDYRFAPVRQTYEAFAALVADLLRDEPTIAAVTGTTPDDLAWTLVLALRGLNEAATDANELRRRIAHVLDLTVAALATGASHAALSAR